MAEGKWIHELHPDTPAGEAAQRVLAARLGAVLEWIDRLREPRGADLEPVHQLRVSTRRAVAALEIFADFLPGKVLRRVKRTLRGLRRAAGAARDADVFLLALRERREQAPLGEVPGLDFLAGSVHRQREEAECGLTAALSVGEARVGEVASAVQPGKSGAVLRDLAAVEVAKRARELVRTAADGRDSDEHLHQIRIAGKRLRYAMEVFAPCYPASFREKLYPAVEEMQEILGRANDSRVACQRLATVMDELTTCQPEDAPRYLPGLEGLLRLHERRLPEERQRFADWWGQWRTSLNDLAGWPAAFGERLAPDLAGPKVAVHAGKPASGARLVG